MKVYFSEEKREFKFNLTDFEIENEEFEYTGLNVDDDFKICIFFGYCDSYTPYDNFILINNYNHLVEI